MNKIVRSIKNFKGFRSLLIYYMIFLVTFSMVDARQRIVVDKDWIVNADDIHSLGDVEVTVGQKIVTTITTNGSILVKIFISRSGSIDIDNNIVFNETLIGKMTIEISATNSGLLTVQGLSVLATKIHITIEKSGFAPPILHFLIVMIIGLFLSYILPYLFKNKKIVINQKMIKGEGSVSKLEHLRLTFNNEIQFYYTFPMTIAILFLFGDRGSHQGLLTLHSNNSEFLNIFLEHSFTVFMTYAALSLILLYYPYIEAVSKKVNNHHNSYPIPELSFSFARNLISSSFIALIPFVDITLNAYITYYTKKSLIDTYELILGFIILFLFLLSWIAFYFLIFQIISEKIVRLTLPLSYFLFVSLKQNFLNKLNPINKKIYDYNKENFHIQNPFLEIIQLISIFILYTSILSIYQYTRKTSNISIS